MAMLITLILFFLVAGFLVWYLLSKDKGQREPTGQLWIALGFGVFAIIPAIILETLLLPGNVEETNMEAGVALTTAFGVGLIEEFVKFVPLALYIYKKRFFNEHTDGLLYFALAGIGFGLPENLMYTLAGGFEAGIGRLLIVPFFHSATTAILGYYLVKIKIEGGKLAQLTVPVLCMVGLHTFYDFFLFMGNDLLMLISLLLGVLATTLLFVYVIIAKRRDQKLGLSVVGINTFCRSCGHPNPKHLLYCQHCGKNA